MQLLSDFKKKLSIFIVWASFVPLEASLIFLNPLDSHVIHVRIPASHSE